MHIGVIVPMQGCNYISFYVMIKATIPKVRGECMSFFNAVEKLVEQGRFNYGHYNEKIKELNPLEADFFRSYTPELFKQSRLKEWQLFNIYCNSFSGLLLLMDLKYVQVTHVSIYDIQKKRFYKKTAVKPPMTFDLLKGIDAGQFFFSEDNLFIEITASEEQMPLHLNLSFVSETDQIPIKLVLEGDRAEAKPFVYCKPIQSEKAVYSHRKTQAAKGSIMISSVLHPFDQAETRIISEDYKSFQPYEMNASWLCASAPELDLALALSVNPYSKDSAVLENVIWQGSEAFPIGNITVDIGPEGWKITSEDGILDLLFVPKTLNQLSESFAMLKASFDLPSGELSGRIVLKDRGLLIENVQAVGGNLMMKL